MKSSRLKTPKLSTCLLILLTGLGSCNDDALTSTSDGSASLGPESQAKSSSTSPTTEAVRPRLRRYLESRLNGKWGQAYRLSTSRQSEEDYVTSAQRVAPLAHLLGAYSSYTIVSLTQTNGIAEAVVQVTMPDLTPVFQRLIMQGVKSEMLQVQTTYEPILEDLVRNLAEGKFDTTSQVQRFKMTRKDDRQWYVEESEREVPTEHQ